MEPQSSSVSNHARQGGYHNRRTRPELADPCPAPKYTGSLRKIRCYFFRGPEEPLP
jgi:hypothetical protein